MEMFKFALLTVIAAGVVEVCAGQDFTPVFQNEASLVRFGSSATLPFALPKGTFHDTEDGIPLFLFRFRPALLSGQSSTAARNPKRQVTRVKRTAIDPSMVGYIEDAGINTEIRIRFDAAAHDDAPDRAEFFYAKCGCYRGLVGAAYDANSPGPGTGIPQYVDFQELRFQGEYAVHSRISLLTQFPLRWIQPHSLAGNPPAFSNGAGLGDIQLGMKVAAVAAPSTILTFMLRGAIPSGDSRRGLGTAHGTLEPSILVYSRFPGKLSVEAEIGDSHPIGGALGNPTSGPKFAGDVFRYGLGTSYPLVQSEHFRLAPVIEFVVWHIFGGEATNRPNPDGINIANAKIGPRMSFGEHSSLYVGYGVALTSQNWYRDIFRTEYRYAF